MHLLIIGVSGAYSEPRQISKMQLFAKIVTDRKPLILFLKTFILDVWQDSEYAPECLIGKGVWVNSRTDYSRKLRR